MTRGQQIALLQCKISGLTKDLDQLRSECKHDEGRHIGHWSFRVGHSEIRYICNVCQNSLSDPVTSEDLVKFRAEEVTRRKQFLRDEGNSEADIKIIMELNL